MRIILSSKCHGGGVCAGACRWTRGVDVPHRQEICAIGGDHDPALILTRRSRSRDQRHRPGSDRLRRARRQRLRKDLTGLGHRIGAHEHQQVIVHAAMRAGGWNRRKEWNRGRAERIQAESDCLRRAKASGVLVLGRAHPGVMMYFGPACLRAAVHCRRISATVSEL